MCATTVTVTSATGLCHSLARFILVQIPIVPNGKYPHSEVVICPILLDCINLASLFGDLGKQCRHRLFCGVWSRSALFAYRIFVRIRMVYLWNSETTIILQDLWLGKFIVPCSHQRSEFTNAILCIFSSSIRELSKNWYKNENVHQTPLK